MKTKILGAVAGLAALAAVAGAGAGSAAAHKVHHVHVEPICGFTWVKVYPKHLHGKHFHHHHFFTWKQVWKCGRPLFYY